MTKHIFSTRNLLILILFLAFYSKGLSQDSLTSEEPTIMYADFFLGSAKLGGEDGVVFGAELCHQYKNRLLTARITVNPRKTIDGRILWIFNNVSERRVDIETAFLYGFREIEKGASWNASVGLSFNRYTKRNYPQNSPEIVTAYSYVGLPYEFSFKLFKAKKRRYWMVIPLGPIPIPFPVGKPTVFGRGVGFKFFGNLSKRSYFAFGISYGWGVHRKY